MKNRLPQMIALAFIASLLVLTGCKKNSSANYKYDRNKPRRHDDFFQKAHGDKFIEQRRAELAKAKKRSFELPEKRKVAARPRPSKTKLPARLVVPQQVQPKLPKVKYAGPSHSYASKKITLGKKDIQGMLRSLGFYSGPIDGKFGKKSISAIKSFQKRNSLKVDGVPGQATKSKLVQEAWSSNKRDLSLQMMLRQLGYYEGPIDGVAGKMTKTAVRKFQQENGLKVDGVAGKKTQAQLRRLAGNILAANS